MLFVDLDKTLIKSDYLLESLVKYFSKNLFAPVILIYLLLFKGKVGLKKFLFEKTKISVANLPFNHEVLYLISQWKINNPGEKVILISATYYKAVNQIANYLKCFDESYGSENINLKSENKLKKINDLTKNKKFSYVGDSFADLIIWEKAKKCFLVRPSKSLIKKVKRINTSIKIVEKKNNNLIKEIIKTIRLHQWAKNFLIFIPVTLSFNSYPDLVQNLVSGFLAFSLISSAFYIVNDIFDIENDRLHHTKKYRPFSSGSLSIIHGLYIFCFLIFSAILLSANLSQNFQIILLFYSFCSLTYTKYIKKIPILDILVLSILYLLRLLAGGALFGIIVSNWLMTFSIFFFLFLASVKRWVELIKVNKKNLSGRGYKNIDIQFISNISYFSGLLCVVVICLYIESQQALAIYNDSKTLWLMPLILLYWILEILFNVGRNKVDDDTVKYALKSKTSYICLISIIIILLTNAKI